MKFKKYKLKSGKVKWGFYHYFGIDPDTGKEDSLERQGFDTKGEAREELLRLIKKHEKDERVKKSKKDNYHFEEVTKLWLQQYEKTVRITTFNSRKKTIELHILPRFKGYFMNRIDVRMCQEAVNYWYSSYSEASRLVNFVTRIFQFAINQGFCKDNPMSKTIRPKNTHKTEYNAPFFEKDELQKFLKAIKENEMFRDYSIFHLLAFTGLRRGELLGLRWKDINFQRKILHVNQTVYYDEKERIFKFGEPKTKASKREIGIDDATIQTLLRWRNLQREFLFERGYNISSSNQLVFTSHNNHVISEGHLRTIIKRITEEYHLPHITIHGFRHTHCSLLFEAGIDMQNVKDRLGHSDIKTTMNIYAHVTKSERSKTADLFGDFMESSSF